MFLKTKADIPWTRGKIFPHIDAATNYFNLVICLEDFTPALSNGRSTSTPSVAKIVEALITGNFFIGDTCILQCKL